MSVGFFFKPKVSLHCKVPSAKFSQAVACKNGLLPEITDFLAFFQLNYPIQKWSAVSILLPGFLVFIGGEFGFCLELLS